MIDLYIILSVSILLIIFQIFYILYKYKPYLIAWLGNKSIWNSNYDRVRLFSNLIFSGIGLYLLFLIYTDKNNFKYSLFHTISFYIVPMFIGLLSYLIHLSWSNKFTSNIKITIPSPKNKIDETLIEEITPITHNQNHLKTIFKNSIDNKFLEGEIETFFKLVNLKPLGNSKQLKWIHFSPTKKGVSNKQSLINYITTLFPDLEPMGSQKIVELIDTYFVDLNNEYMFRDLKNKSKPITDWKNNNSRYLKEMYNLLTVSIILCKQKLDGFSF